MTLLRGMIESLNTVVNTGRIPIDHIMSFTPSIFSYLYKELRKIKLSVYMFGIHLTGNITVCSPSSFKK